MNKHKLTATEILREEALAQAVQLNAVRDPVSTQQVLDDAVAFLKFLEGAQV